MNPENVAALKKARSMCLLYGVVCLLSGLAGFTLYDQDLLGSILVVVAILGFWRVAHKIKLVLKSEDPKFFKEFSRDKDAYGR